MEDKSTKVFMVVISVHVEGKYFKEDLFGKYLDCNLAYIAMISNPPVFHRIKSETSCDISWRGSYPLHDDVQYR